MDLFSQQFIINITKNRKKQKTHFGMGLSILIIILALSFLGYLFYKFFNDEFVPKITRQKNQFKENNYTFQGNPIQFGLQVTPQKMLQVLGGEENGAMEKYLQMMDNDRMFSASAFLMNPKTLTRTPLKLEQCTDTEFIEDPKAYLCLNSEDQEIKIDQNFKGEGTVLVVIIGRCQLFKDESECEAREMQEVLMTEFDFAFVVDFISVNYDTKLEQEIKSLKRKFIPGDEQTMQIIDITLNAEVIKYDKGFLVNQVQEKKVLSSYDLDPSTLSTDQAFKRLGNVLNMKQSKDIMGMLQFNISLNEDEVNVEYIKFSEILAQFLSIWNVLFAIGIIAQLVSEAVITEEIMENSLQTQYKQTAFYIEKQRIHEAKKNNPNAKISKLHLIKSSLGLKALLNTFSKKKTTKTENSDKESQADLEFQQLYQVVYQTLQDRCEEETNIFWMLNEITKLKTILHLIITPEQYAAILNCGKRIPETINQKYSILNHLEQLQKVEENEQFRKQQLENVFLKKIQNNRHNLSQIDRNIDNCLLIHNQDEPIINQELKDQEQIYQHVLQTKDRLLTGGQQQQEENIKNSDQKDSQ